MAKLSIYKYMCVYMYTLMYEYITNAMAQQLES